jgi:hypothetical protein
MCAVEQLVSRRLREQLKSRDLCVQAAIKALKNMPKGTGRITGQSFNMAKITFCS